MKYYRLDPEVSGEIGPNSILNTTVHPPIPEKVEFLFKGWLGDCLVESFPVYLILDEVSELLMKEKITGFELDQVTVKKVYPFFEFNASKSLPNFQWLKIVGTGKESDFGLIENQLVVSERVLSILKRGGLNHCDVDDVE